MQLHLAALFSLLAATSGAETTCKSSPGSATWPSLEEWNALNKSIDGTLLRTVPAASSCYTGNPFNSKENCTAVKDYWSYAAYHAAWPESVDYLIFTNQSCIPPRVDGYFKGRGCEIGALPQYIVNATSEKQIATAMKWATERDIRVVVKGTRHDMSGRSTGAFSLSIWIHNLKNFHHDAHWRIPGTNSTADVAILGSGNNWGSAYTAVHAVNRLLVGGEDATVGLGGLIQNGGHGLLSSTHGLASDSLYQVTSITTDGRRLIANDVQNKDIFWAIRGAGGGQFGVVTEFVLATHPVPQNVVTGGLTFYAAHGTNETDAWNALVETARFVPEIMDAGIAGTVMVVTGQKAAGMLGLDDPVAGPAAILSLTGFNMTTGSMNATANALASRIGSASRGTVTFVPQDPSSKSYWESTKPDQLASQTSGSSSMISSRLLGKRELVHTPRDKVRSYLQKVLTTSTFRSDSDAGSVILFGLQGGPGTASTPEVRRGSTHPAWRSAYAHVMTYSAPVNSTGDPSESLATGAEWYEENIEPVWREWAHGGGSYANEGNVFSGTFKEDFYGVNYDRLLEIKGKYDPTGSLFVWGGVGSDEWVYDLHDGLLCRV